MIGKSYYLLKFLFSRIIFRVIINKFLQIKLSINFSCGKYNNPTKDVHFSLNVELYHFYRIRLKNVNLHVPIELIDIYLRHVESMERCLRFLLRIKVYVSFLSLDWPRAYIHQDSQDFLLATLVSVAFWLMLLVLPDNFCTPPYRYAVASCIFSLLAYYIRRNYFIEFRQVRAEHGRNAVVNALIVALLHSELISAT